MKWHLVDPSHAFVKQMALKNCLMLCLPQTILYSMIIPMLFSNGLGPSKRNTFRNTKSIEILEPEVQHRDVVSGMILLLRETERAPHPCGRGATVSEEASLGKVLMHGMESGRGDKAQGWGGTTGIPHQVHT